MEEGNQTTSPTKNAKMRERIENRKMLSKRHWQIMAIQNDQLSHKANELRFIAEHCERIIELMYEKAEESRDGYAQRDAYDLWRGHDIDSYVRHTNWPASMSAYHTVKEEVE